MGSRKKGNSLRNLKEKTKKMCSSINPEMGKPWIISEDAQKRKDAFEKEQHRIFHRKQKVR